MSICARQPEALEKTRAEIAALGVTAHALPADLGEATEVARWVMQAATALGGVDVLVNNASGFGARDTEEDWARGLNVDVMATVRASRAAAPFLRATQGSIVNVTSISGFRPSMRTPAYAAVKALLVNYTSSQAAAFAAEGVRVNAVAPGSIEFPGGSWEQRRTGDPALYDRILALDPLRPARHAGGGRRGRDVPGEPRRTLGHGADDHRGWRAAAELSGRDCFVGFAPRVTHVTRFPPSRSSGETQARHSGDPHTHGGSAACPACRSPS